MIPCPYPACNKGECPCGRCHGSGWYYEEDPSGEREDHGWPGTEGPRLLEKYCDCESGRRLHYLET